MRWMLVVLHIIGTKSGEVLGASQNYGGVEPPRTRGTGTCFPQSIASRQLPLQTKDDEVGLGHMSRAHE